MKAEIYGSIKEPVVAVIGVWDPLMQSHQQLFIELNQYAQKIGKQSLAIMMEPHPAFLLNGASNWPVYDDVKTRIAFLSTYQLDGTLLVTFEREDIEKSAATFLNYVHQHVQLSELWIGAKQSLGPGPEGGFQAIQKWAESQEVGVRLLPKLSFANRSLAGLCIEVRQLLKVGRLAEAVKIVERPPIWMRPESGRILLSWRSGNYTAIPLDAPGQSPCKLTICVSLVPEEKGLSSFEWPDIGIECLAFISGPADNKQEK